MGQLRNDVDDFHDILGEIRTTLTARTTTLDGHTATLDQHTRKLDQIIDLLHSK